MGNSKSKQPADEGGGTKQKGRGSEASAKGEYTPDEFQTAAFDLKCLIQDSEALEERLQGEIDKARQRARAYMKEKPPRKDRAVFLMKVSKLHMKHINEVQNRMVLLQKTLDGVYGAREQRAFVESLREGNKALKMLQDGIGVDVVQRLLDEKVELEDVQEEVSQLLAEAAGMDGFDDDTLLAEVDAALDGEEQEGKEEAAAPPSQEKEPAAAVAEEEAAAAAASAPAAAAALAEGEATQGGATAPLDLPAVPTHDIAETDAARRRKEEAAAAAAAAATEEEAQKAPVLVAAE